MTHLTLIEILEHLKNERDDMICDINSEWIEEPERENCKLNYYY